MLLGGKNKRLNKIISSLLLVGVLTSNAPVHVFATGATTTPTTNTANQMTNSMLTFFREERTGLNSDRVARDEVMTYGVFISNFFVPGQTVLKDLIDNTKDTSMPKVISKKFFGSADKAADVVKINQKIYDAIAGTLKDSSKDFGLYTSPANATAGNVMSGIDFYKLFGSSGDRKLYSATGQVVMNLNDNATRGAWQVLFGFSPELLLSKEQGLRAFTKLYIDALGNIWASYTKDNVNVTLEEYVLLFPSCLNPVVFSNSTDNCKFPVTNAFTMGGALRITEDFLKDEKGLIPYYNIKDKFTTGSSESAKVNRENMLTIYGVQSPLGYIGNSNSILLNGVGTNPLTELNKFIGGTASDSFTNSNASIILAMDLTNFDAGIYFKDDTAYTPTEKYTIFDYFTASTTFRLSELADNMYYFSGVKEANGDQGNWSKQESLIQGHKLFAKKSSGSYNFYSDSYFASPFNRFLVSFYTAGEEDNALIDLIKAINPETSTSTSTKEFKNLKNFFKTGTFIYKTKAEITSTMALLLPKGADYVYDFVPPATLSTEAIIQDNKAKWYNWFPTDRVSLKSFGLSDYDSVLSQMSYAAIKKDSKVKYSIPTYGAFEAGTSGGGLINDYVIPDQHISNISDVSINNMFMYLNNALTYRIFSMNSTFVNNLTSTKYAGSKIKGPLATTDDLAYTTKTAVMNDVNNWPGIYWGYMVQFLGIEMRDGQLTNTTSFTNKWLPNMVISTVSGGFDLSGALNGSGAVSSEDKTMEEMQKDIIKKVYGLLSDSPNSYRDKLIKATQDSWVISTHRAITGSWAGNVLSVSAGGGGSYASVVGYINTPNLEELPITSWILKDYPYIYAFLLLLVLIVIIMMVLTNVRSPREGVLVFILMCFVLMLPQFLLNNVINISNSVGNKIYSQRFNYWAITQNQQAQTSLMGASKTGDGIDTVIAQSMQAAQNVYSSDAGVRLKWMSPKKNDAFTKLFDSSTTSQSLQSNLTIFRWLFNSVLNQEEYVYKDSLSTYLYRPYNDLANVAKSSYGDLAGAVLGKDAVIKNVKDVKAGDLNLPDYRFMLLTNPTDSKVVFSDEHKKTVDSVTAYTADPTNKAKIEDYRYWVMGNVSIASDLFRSNYELTNAGITGSTDDKYSNAYLLATESPFYYFYNVINSRYRAINGGFKNALLAKEVFKIKSDNPNINNTTRDFLDMEGLFTYVIPYLHEGNAYVYGWTSKYGKDIDGFNFAQDALGVDPNDTALATQYAEAQNKKAQLQNIWKMYTPWVDQMYNLDVYNKKAGIAKKNIFVEDSMNPGSYEIKGRPMIFSEADMFAKNYKVKDLTDIERRIQSTLDKTYTDLMYLTNYYDFSDEVLMTAAAMMATFNFDREFSQNKILGDSVQIYPQNFELKNFNYDAFMRLALLNATGEPLMADADLYSRILDKTSIFTGLILLVKDITGVVLIPGMKVVVLLMTLLLGLMVSIASVINKPDKLLKQIWKHIGVPMAIFFASSVAFAFIISMFMGEGLTGYVGSRTPSAGMTDPTIVMLIMIVVDCVYLFLMFKTLLILVNAFKSFGVASFFGAVNVVTGAVGTVAGGIRNGFSSLVDRGLHRNDTNKINNSRGKPLNDERASNSYKRSTGSEGDTTKYERSQLPKNKSTSDKGNYCRDTSFIEDLNIKSSTIEGNKKTLGQRAVDAKYAPGNAVRNATQPILKPVKKTIYKVNAGVEEYKNDIQTYELQKIQKRIEVGTASEKDYRKGSNIVKEVSSRNRVIKDLNNKTARLEKTKPQQDK